MPLSLNSESPYCVVTADSAAHSASGSKGVSNSNAKESISE